MKKLLVLLCALMSASILTAQRIDVATAKLSDGSPEAFAIKFVRVAHAGDLEKAKSMVSEDFFKSMTLHGHKEDQALIEPFLSADLDKLFQYHMSVPPSEKYPNECAITIRFYTTARERNTNFGFSLKKTDGNWLIIRDGEREAKKNK